MIGLIHFSQRNEIANLEKDRSHQQDKINFDSQQGSVNRANQGLLVGAIAIGAIFAGLLYTGMDPDKMELGCVNNRLQAQVANLTQTVGDLKQQVNVLENVAKATVSDAAAACVKTASNTVDAILNLFGEAYGQAALDAFKNTCASHTQQSVSEFVRVVFDKLDGAVSHNAQTIIDQIPIACTNAVMTCETI